MRNKDVKTTHDKLGLKDKIEEKNVKTLKKGQEQRIETKRAMIKSKGKTNWGAALKIWKATQKNRGGKREEEKKKAHSAKPKVRQGHALAKHGGADDKIWTPPWKPLFGL